MSFVSGTGDNLHFSSTPECTKCCNELPFHVLGDDGQWTRVVQGGSDPSTSETHLFVGSSVYGIRYAWESYPQCILYNGDGGPDDHLGIAAAPFEWCAYPSDQPIWTGRRCTVPGENVEAVSLTAV
jgi:hypothetical protein